MNDECDLLVIGGGINGTAIARDASLRGLKVILLEKHDFAYGASSKNSKLAHGGLRYLKYFQFKLIKESLRERSILLKTAPNLVQPLPFVVPSYKNSPVPLWLLRLGLSVYDFLSPKGIEKHKNLTTDQIKTLAPNLKVDQLQGGCLYYDALMEDSRLVIENALAAEDCGAKLLNYAGAVNFLCNDENKVYGVSYRNSLTSEEGEIRSKVIVNATGAWSNQLTDLNPGEKTIEVFPTKGVHLILPQIHPTHAFLLTAPQDGRVFFLIPWKGYSLLGTTDTPFSGDPNNVMVEESDILYLLIAFNEYFPSLNFGPSAIISHFAGLRPLVKNHVKEASRVSRDYVIDKAASGLITLLGGKYTTYRLMAEKTVDKVLHELGKPCSKSQTADLPLSDFELSPSLIESISKECQIERIQTERLAKTYGKRCPAIFEIIKNSPQMGKPICSAQPHLWAELDYAIKYEKAKTPEDWFERRTSIAYTSCGGIRCREAVDQYFHQEKHVDSAPTNTIVY